MDFMEIPQESRGQSCGEKRVMNSLNRNNLLRYLNHCRTPDGGYCYFRDPESGVGFPNGADTFWALSAFQFLESDPPFLTRTRRWLRNELDQNVATRTSPYLFWFLEGLHLSRAPFSLEDRLCLVRETARLLDNRASSSDLPSLLDDLGSVLSLRRGLHLSLSEKEKGRLKELLDLELDLPRSFSLPELWTRSVLMEESGGFSQEKIAKERSRENEYRHPVFGYVILPGSSRSDLFVLRSGLLMRKAPLSLFEIQMLEDLILSCQSWKGGFGPVGGAVPTLEATSVALELTVLLSHFRHPTR